MESPELMPYHSSQPGPVLPGMAPLPHFDSSSNWLCPLAEGWLPNLTRGQLPTDLTSFFYYHSPSPIPF